MSNTDEGPVVQKRKVVSFDDRDTEVQESKRQRVELDETTKLRVIKAIAIIYRYATTKYGLDPFNLHVSAQISNIVLTAFRRMKQEISSQGNLRVHDSKNFTVMHLGSEISIPRKEIEQLLREVFTWMNLPMSAPTKSEKSHWWGTMMPYMAYCCGWKHRLDELRVGHSKFPVGKKGDERQEVKTSEFGIGSKYHIFCEGISFPPEVRSSMAQSVGPITAIIGLVKETKGSKFVKKQRDAVARAFTHLDPQLDPVLDALERSTAASASPLVLALAKLCMVIPPRNQRRAFFPMAWISLLALTDEETKHYMCKFKTTEGSEGTSSRMETEIKEACYTPSTLFVDKEQKIPATENMNLWDHSGKGAILNYNSIADVAWKFPKVKEHSDEIASQAVFHAVWGTYCEDLSLLQWMTTEKKWFKRHHV